MWLIRLDSGKKAETRRESEDEWETEGAWGTQIECGGHSGTQLLAGILMAAWTGAR